MTASTITPQIVDYITPPPGGDVIATAFQKTQTNIDNIANSLNTLITGGTLPIISGQTIQYENIIGGSASTISTNTLTVETITGASSASTLNLSNINVDNITITNGTFDVLDGNTININTISGNTASTLSVNSLFFTIVSGDTGSTINGNTANLTNAIISAVTANTIQSNSINVSGDVIVNDDMIAFGVSGNTAEFDVLTVSTNIASNTLNVTSAITAGIVNTTNLTVSGGTLQTLAPITQHKESFVINQSGTTRESVIMGRPFTVNTIVMAGVSLTGGTYTNIAFDTLNSVFADVYLNGVLQQSFEVPFDNGGPGVPSITNFASPFTAGADDIISIGTSNNPWDSSNKKLVVTLIGNLIL